MAEDILRFKDIQEMDGQEPFEKPLSFNDLHTTQYRPGEDELTNYRAYRRKRIPDTQYYGPTGNELGESVDYSIEEDVDEALTTQQRMQRRRTFQRIKPKIKLGRERAKRRIASKEKLLNRTRRQVRQMMLKKFTKDIPKSELTFARRQEIEKRLEKPAIKKRIDMIVKKEFPKVRKAELARKRGGK